METDGSCIECIPGEIPNDAKDACMACPDGSAETANGICTNCTELKKIFYNVTVCDTCQDIDHFFDETTNTCQLCSDDTKPNEDQTNCIPGLSFHFSRVSNIPISWFTSNIFVFNVFDHELRREVLKVTMLFLCFFCQFTF